MILGFFNYPYEFRRLIYTTNIVEGYHRQLRKVTKNKNACYTRQKPSGCSGYSPVLPYPSGR
ncbi:MAG: hypothetical protein CVU87_13720 [Firmicutes bacterium HGW-Firmicutes-12]|nr:MAG: hypothetical protein CVU87_13720 [Firmicutes bacterium HGW-Firmicutes-12]